MEGLAHAVEGASHQLSIGGAWAAPHLGQHLGALAGTAFGEAAGQQLGWLQDGAHRAGSMWGRRQAAALAAAGGSMQQGGMGAGGWRVVVSAWKI